MSPQYHGIELNRTAHVFQIKIDVIKRDDVNNSWRGPDDYFAKKNAQDIEYLETRIRRVAFP